MPTARRRSRGSGGVAGCEKCFRRPRVRAGGQLDKIHDRASAGAAGSVEAILTILALRDNVAPPTINLDNPGEGCDLNYVPHHAQERPIRHALSNSFGFGGTNGSLIFSELS